MFNKRAYRVARLKEMKKKIMKEINEIENKNRNQ